MARKMRGGELTIWRRRHEDGRMMEGYVPGQNSIVDAAWWLQHLLTGSVATIIAVLAVAATGAAMLTGRVDVRRGAAVIVGCFLLFGASTITTGLYAVLTGTSGGSALRASIASPKVPSVPKSVSPYDPYAGAAVPQSR